MDHDFTIEKAFVSLESADDLYERIRESNSDIDEIAANTGLKASHIAKAKQHLFLQRHWFDFYEGLEVPAEWRRFDSYRQYADS